MTRNEKCSLPARIWYILITLLIFVYTSQCTLFVNGWDVVFYKDVGFKGPMLYNFTLPAEVESENYNLFLNKHCFDLDSTKGQPSSLKTSNFIVLLDYPHCDPKVYETRHCYNGYELVLRPGEYTDLPKYLDDSDFPCPVLSFAPHYNTEQIINNKEKIYFSEDINGGHVVALENFCGCVDLPKFTYERVRELHGNNDHCVKLFSKPKCEGKSVVIAPGHMLPSIAHDDMVLILLRSQPPQGICINSSVQEYKVCAGDIPAQWKPAHCQHNVSSENAVLESSSFSPFHELTITFLVICFFVVIFFSSQSLI